MPKQIPPDIGGGDPDRKSGHARHRKTHNAAKSVNDSKAQRKSATSLNTLNSALDPSLWESVRWQANSSGEGGFYGPN